MVSGKSLLLSLLGALACQTPKEDDAIMEALSQQEDASIETSRLREKVAALWIRVEDLDQTVARQQQEIQLLENRIANREKEVRGSEGDIAPPKKIGKPERLLIEPIAVGEARKKEFFSQLSYAKRLFGERRFGKAFIEFSRLERELPLEENEGEARFWLARCWLELGEFQTAWQFFKTYVEEFPEAAFTVSSQFFMAKAELGMGRKDDAVIRLKNIITRHPYESSAETAKQLLASIEREK